jgi:hypothetical protein
VIALICEAGGAIEIKVLLADFISALNLIIRVQG